MIGTSSKHDVEVSLQGTVIFGGRGTDRIRKVKKKDNTYRLYIDTNEGQRCVAKLNMDEPVLNCYGNTRVHPFMKLELSQNGAETLAADIESEYDVIDAN